MGRILLITMLGTVAAVSLILARPQSNLTSASPALPVNALVEFERAVLERGTELANLPVEELREHVLLGSDGKPVADACFAPGTPLEVVQAFNKAMYGDDDLDYYLFQRWPGTVGSPITLRWSFVPDGVSIAGGSGEPTSPSNLFATMDAVVAREVWVNRFQQVMDRWSELSGVTYTRITYGGQAWDDGAAWGAAGSANRGDIRIGMHYIDGESNVLGWSATPPGGGDTCLDSGDVSSWADSTNEHRMLRQVVAHENGHGLGLNHVCPSNGTKLLEPYIYLGYDGPRHDDIRGMQRQYGDPFGANSSAAAATDLGTLSDPQNASPCLAPPPVSGTNDTEVTICSIDLTGEADYFKFTVALSAGKATVVVAPRGKEYDNQPQGSGGECPAGNTIDSQAVADLVLELLDTDGTTVLASSNGAPAGGAEALVDVLLPDPGTYFVRIKASGTVASTQLYEFAVSYACAPIINSNPLTHWARVGTSTNFSVAASGVTSYLWYKDGNPLSNGGNISGATAAVLTINPVTKPDAGAYYVEVTNACGQRTTDPATLWINGDCNCDGAIDFDDINAFVLLLNGCTGYHQVYPDCSCLSGDCNGDNSVNYGDINPFVNTLVQ